MKNTLRVNASAAGFAFAGFLGMYALDAPLSFATLIHLLPSFLAGAVCFLGMKKAFYGAAGAWLLAAAFTLYFHTYRVLTNFMIVTVPLILVAVMYTVSAALRERKERPNENV